MNEAQKSIIFYSLNQINFDAICFQYIFKYNKK